MLSRGGRIAGNLEELYGSMVRWRDMDGLQRPAFDESLVPRECLVIATRDPKPPLVALIEHGIPWGQMSGPGGERWG